MSNCSRVSVAFVLKGLVKRMSVLEGLRTYVGQPSVHLTVLDHAIATADLSVRLSVRHVLVLCPDE